MPNLSIGFRWKIWLKRQHLILITSTDKPQAKLILFKFINLLKPFSRHLLTIFISGKLIRNSTTLNKSTMTVGCYSGIPYSIKIFIRSLRIDVYLLLTKHWSSENKYLKELSEFRTLLQFIFWKHSFKPLALRVAQKICTTIFSFVNSSNSILQNMYSTQ